MIKLVHQLLNPKSGRTYSAPSDLAPNAPFVAVGDIHGRLDLLQTLLGHLENQAPELPLIFLGDYIDRGPKSAEVLRQLQIMSASTPARAVCLMGNHEAMLLDFLDHPESAGPQWLRNGGWQTLGSFGIEKSDAKMPDLRDRLVLHAGEELLDWLRQCPLFWQSGNIIASHAGGDPTRQPDPRRAHDLLWGHENTRKSATRAKHWMVYGHYIVDAPSLRQGRIEIDTGAWQTGRLTAAIISPKQVQFLST
ncbi:metallophosphoesterase [Roseovarius aestuariivivens]|uniref:metallophosphoesterase n=1 Tax=Roseovarius aestuariivivens TaxID=1888910 RepID=UPI0024780A43|nr:metallophosphoesterase [Roseovarius aestuariivivens]